MNDNILVGETDAQKWARRWLEVIAENPAIPTDEGAMVSWFAVAIMAGHDEGRRREQRRDISEKLREIIFQAAGAATAPLLEDHPSYVFPTERVTEGIERVCSEFGLPKKD